MPGLSRNEGAFAVNDYLPPEDETAHWSNSVRLAISITAAALLLLALAGLSGLLLSGVAVMGLPLAYAVPGIFVPAALALLIFGFDLRQRAVDAAFHAAEE